MNNHKKDESDLLDFISDESVDKKISNQFTFEYQTVAPKDVKDLISITNDSNIIKNINRNDGLNLSQNTTAQYTASTYLNEPINYNPYSIKIDNSMLEDLNEKYNNVVDNQ